MEKYSTSKISKEILKTLLTSPTECGIIRVSRGRGAEPQELWFICAVAKAKKEK
jgi:hypothetical protein